MAFPSIGNAPTAFGLGMSEPTTTEEEYVDRLCNSLKKQEWPESRRIYFDGSCFEDYPRIRAMNSILEALGSNSNAEVMAVRNLTFTMPLRNEFQRSVVTHPTLRVLDLYGVRSCMLRDGIGEDGHQVAASVGNDSNNTNINNRTGLSIDGNGQWYGCGFNCMCRGDKYSIGGDDDDERDEDSYLLSGENLMTRLSQLESIEIETITRREITSIISPTGLATLIGHSTSTIRSLNLTNANIGQNIQPFTEALRNDECKNLTEFRWNSSSLTQRSLLLLLEAIGDNRSIKVLELSNNELNLFHATAIATMLSKNSSIRELDMASNHICGESMGIIAKHGLMNNSTLQELVLSFNPIGDAGIVHLTDLLTMPTGEDDASSSRCRLQKLGVTNCSIWKQGGEYLARGIARMATLKMLTINWDVLNDNIEHLHKSMESANKQLERLIATKLSYYPEQAVCQYWMLVQYFLGLNRSGRQLLARPDVPASLWPLVLEKSMRRPDLMYYMIRSNPNLHFQLHDGSIGDD